MKLADVIANLDRFDEDTILCARRPWVATAPCEVVPPDENLAVPAHIKAAGFEYFLEVHVAREVLGVLANRLTTHEDRVRLLIFYAENDAYPDWAHAR